MRKSSTLAALLLCGVAAPALAQAGQIGERPVEPNGQPLPDPMAANVRVDGAVVEPRRVNADVASLRVPEGYRIEVFADGLGNARMLRVADDGTVYLTRRDEGDVMMLRDVDGDGRADMRSVLARRPLMHGIEIDGRTAYLIAGERIYRTAIAADGSFGALDEIVDDLPSTGQHPARMIARGPDGMFYVSIGSTCNACAESSPESAAMLRMTPDGKSRTIFASGLRHTIGYDWHPRTGALWGMDHGIDWLGDRQQIEELNHIERGRSYGWPYIYGQGGWNPQDEPPGGLTMEDWDRMSRRAVTGYSAHAAPMQMAFYRGGMFPLSAQGDAFVTMRGSWNRSDPSGYEVVRVRFGPDGQPTGMEPFVTGFLRTGPNGPTHSGRPVGLAVARDGALLFTDDVNGVIYRVSYAGADRSPVMPATLAPPMTEEPRPFGTALAGARAETRTSGRLAVSSGDFRGNAPIPPVHSAYYEGVSPALSWSAGPAGTRSYALLMEDPDAPVGLPFVHWTMWNIPAGTTSLPEALPAIPQLPDLGNARQGTNTRGSVGYFGPRPAIGDRPHRYHFQLFALDTVLPIVPGAGREELLAAMQGHVLATGTLVGTYRQPAPPPR